MRSNPSKISLTEQDAGLVKGMKARGDRNSDIAAYFGVNQGRISEIMTGKRFPNVPAAPITELPPPGPYPPARGFVELYQRLVEINELWNQRKLPLAKFKLETLVSAGIHRTMDVDTANLLDEVFSEVGRDEFGLPKPRRSEQEM